MFRRSVCLLLVALSASVFMQRSLFSQAPAPDLIVVNATVYTVDPRFSTAQAFAVTNGKFTAVGNSAQIRKLAGPSTKILDLTGKTIIPGLEDDHFHATGGGP